MTSLAKTAPRPGWPIITFMALGSLLFGLVLYVSIRSALVDYEDFSATDFRNPVPIIAAMTFGLLLDLRAFVQLCRGTTTSVRNLWNVVEIKSRILFGVFLLVEIPFSALLRFPRDYEFIERLSRNSESAPIHPDFEKIMFVAVAFFMNCLFIYCGLSVLKGAQKVVDRMTAPAADHDSATLATTR